MNFINIEQLQFSGDEKIETAINQININFNHPIKEMIWIVRLKLMIEYLIFCKIEKILYLQTY